MEGLIRRESIIVSNVQSYLVFARLIELAWLKDELVSLDSNEGGKSFWFKSCCNRASFGIAK